MAAQHFAYYDYNDNTPLTCANCGWTGRAKEASGETYSELFDADCPACGQMIAIVSFPTLEETYAAADAGNERAINSLPEAFEREAFLKRFDNAVLRSPDQLPDIDADHFDLHWDFVEVGQGDNKNLIRHGDRVIWEQVAAWECGDLFADVQDILRDRYGERFGTLIPTDESLLWLGGDRYTTRCRQAWDWLPDLEGDRLEFAVESVNDAVDGDHPAVRCGERVVTCFPGDKFPLDSEAIARLERRLRSKYGSRFVRLSGAAGTPKPGSAGPAGDGD